MLYQIKEADKKQLISRKILETLSDWFAIESAREDYIQMCQNQIFFAAFHSDVPIGFISLKETSKSTIEIAVMGVLQEYHRHGIGKKLFSIAYDYSKDHGYKYIQVKTVAMGYYDSYDQTNRFYQRLGFTEFELLPTLWDENNPCLIYIMSIE